MDLTTEYLGMTLKNPLVPSASPLSRSLEMARMMEDAGAAALVMYSLFEEAVTAEEEAMVRFLHHQETGFGEADSFLPDHMDFPGELDRYLEQVAALKATLEIPVIASLNGVTNGGWIDHAKEIQDAGADALELNVYYIAADIDTPCSEVEQRYVELLRELKQHIRIPINMKLSPAFSALGHMLRQLEAAGAGGVSLFNRFYQPDIDIHNLRLTPTLHPSTSREVLLPMRWIALLYGRTGLSLGATSGVHTVDDVIKLLLAGADVVHLCSLLLEKGPLQIRHLLSDLQQWMEEQGFDGVSDVRGRLSHLNVPNPAELERSNYIQVLDSYSPGRGVLT
ncbi:MAG TPA: dihydroorotate dehydrogenase-like protein [Sedimenticola thiotaurini]|uniref:Dihydroorotate dehydrogenase-like protein n=1 Tax=Sedimenticola thiotaurini TaxID=1543721 RepID=A0A831W1T4_9GAMM|nr:dihydroorotate dehydrogenase-like protein [Sedimenticola thiotaurini]